MKTTNLKTRRDFLNAVGLTATTTMSLVGSAMIGSIATACADPNAQDSQPDASTPTECPTPTQMVEHPAGRLSIDPNIMPFRQHDPRWGSELMWNRDLVIKAATELNGESQADAESLLRYFEDGNNLANEGCQITTFAMILRLFDPNANPAWNPSVLNELAQYYYYYTQAGLSLVPVFADLLSDVTGGLVQLWMKEEYLSGEAGWPKFYADTIPIIRAYRSLDVAHRSSYLIMLKTGTWDDTVASHYLLLNPDDIGGPDDRDPLVLDPAMPLDQSGDWRLSDSARAILEDEDIASEWEALGIESTQICGVWVFVRWQNQPRQAILAPLVQAWAKFLS